ncbi:unnamed protein product [Effrenium voratum]|nr:unnamed protein product [Effrenium voratum]
MRGRAKSLEPKLRFNVKTWGSWRMAFVLARLQQQADEPALALANVYQKRFDDEHPEGLPDAEQLATPEAKSKKKGEKTEDQP